MVHSTPFPLEGECDEVDQNKPPLCMLPERTAWLLQIEAIAGYGHEHVGLQDISMKLLIA